MLDIGAGYGRLAHRMTAALPSSPTTAASTRSPESTFLSEYYLRHRGGSPPARVVPLDEVEARAASPGAFDLAVNIHSLLGVHPRGGRVVGRRSSSGSRCPDLLVVPNEPTELLQHSSPTEPRATSRRCSSARATGSTTREPVIDDPAVRELLRLDDHFHLFDARASRP